MPTVDEDGPGLQGTVTEYNSPFLIRSDPDRKMYALSEVLIDYLRTKHEYMTDFVLGGYIPHGSKVAYTLHVSTRPLKPEERCERDVVDAKEDKEKDIKSRTLGARKDKPRK